MGAGPTTLHLIVGGAIAVIVFALFALLIVASVVDLFREVSRGRHHRPRGRAVPPDVYRRFR